MNLARPAVARLAPALPAAALALLAAAPAQAYIGPGVGLGVIGTVFGIVATLALAVFGFLWYPMKRLMAKRRDRRPTPPLGRAEGGADAGGAHAPALDASAADVPAASATPGATVHRTPTAGAAEREQA